MRRRGPFGAVLVVLGLIGAVLPAAPATAQAGPRPLTEGQCVQASSPELYGPTDINAQSANGGLAVGFNRAGTLTVMRWPSPSFYDQVKYQTTSRTLPRFGALANEGAFLGLAITTDAGTSTRWLRDLPHTQGWAADWSDTVVTTYRADDLGLTVTVTDVVAQDADVLARRVDVAKGSGSPVRKASLVAFENLNLVVSKHAAFPTQDWCQEAENVDTATFDVAADAIVHSRAGVDESTRKSSSVAIATGFAGASDAHQVGGDAYEGSASPDGRLPGPTQDAYDDSADGVLRGNSTYTGQTTGAMSESLDLSSGAAQAVVLFAAGRAPSDATAGLALARRAGFDAIRSAKEAWIRTRLAAAPMPVSADEAVMALARRALITLVTTIDRSTGAVVASIATQSPYGEDWIRDGAYFNFGFDVLGFHETVRRRNEFYSDVQRKPADPRADLVAVPPGNWAMNYYADGVVGGPIPWEIDETGFGVWSFWQHYRATQDRAALEASWPAVKLATDFLVTCADPLNRLQCRAIEDDNANLTQTTIGAGPVWLALDSASRAASVLGHDADARRYATRRDELGAAIDTSLWDESAGTYARDATLAWPVCFKPYDDPRMARHLESLWENLQPSLAEPGAGKKLWGAYEAKSLVALAKAWRGDPGRIELVRRGLEWVAHNHATPDTHIEGEVWMLEGGRVVTSVSQPHLWEQLLFWLAAIEAWPPTGFESTAPTCDGVASALGRVDPGTAPSSVSSVSSVLSSTASGRGSAMRELPATGGSTIPTMSLGFAVLALALAGSHLRRRSRGSPSC